ncbi:hypothetical protein DESC_970068 [Desulfosarcina cetonica]|nr:hypothetical protein DESC_970068 [Desulfosarcina cetonica]
MLGLAPDSIEPISQGQLGIVVLICVDEILSGRWVSDQASEQNTSTCDRPDGCPAAA